MGEKQGERWFVEYAALFIKGYNLCCRWASSKRTTYPNILLLMELYVRGGCEAAELADCLYLPRQTMTYMLDSLEKEENIYRESHPTDRRRKIIRLTETGKGFTKEIMEELGTELLGFTQNLPHDKEILLSAVKEFIKELEEKLAIQSKEEKG